MAVSSSSQSVPSGPSNPTNLQLGPDSRLYLAQGGNTNNGAATAPPSLQITPGFVIDPFQQDAAKGLRTYLASSAALDWNFQFGAGSRAPGPSGLFLDLTGHMGNGTRDWPAPNGDTTLRVRIRR